MRGTRAARFTRLFRSGFLSAASASRYRYRLGLDRTRRLREGPQLVRGEAERRHEQDRYGLRRQMARTGGDKYEEEELVGAEREPRDEQRACALAEYGRAGRAERPRAVPEVVARGRHEEGDRRGGEVVQSRGEQRRVDGEVDGIAGGPDSAEAQELALEQTDDPDRHSPIICESSRLALAEWLVATVRVAACGQMRPLVRPGRW